MNPLCMCALRCTRFFGGSSKGSGRTRPALVGPAEAAAAAAATAAVAAATAAAAAEAAVTAAEAALRLRGAAGHLLSALLAPALVERLDKVNLGSLDQALAVLDRREVAEEVLATVVGLDEAEALLVPPAGDTRLAPTAAAAPAPTTAVTTAITVAATVAAVAIAIAGGAAAPAAPRAP